MFYLSRKEVEQILEILYFKVTENCIPLTRGWEGYTESRWLFPWQEIGKTNRRSILLEVLVHSSAQTQKHVRTISMPDIPLTCIWKELVFVLFEFHFSLQSLRPRHLIFRLVVLSSSNEEVFICPKTFEYAPMLLPQRQLVIPTYQCIIIMNSIPNFPKPLAMKKSLTNCHIIRIDLERKRNRAWDWFGLCSISQADFQKDLLQVQEIGRKLLLPRCACV
jgi:hypothetical protein